MQKHILKRLFLAGAVCYLLSSVFALIAHFSGETKGHYFWIIIACLMAVSSIPMFVAWANIKTKN